MQTLDPHFQAMLLGILGLLMVSSLVGFGLALVVRSDGAKETVANLNARIRAWWVMCGVLAAALVGGALTSVLLFSVISFLALREFITLTPTRYSDHSTLFWAFFIFTPIQYYLVATQWYGLFAIFIPVYVFLFVPLRMALTGDVQAFLARSAKVQWGMMLCVYCISHAPALLMLEIDGYAGQNVKLLFFLILVVQLSDVLQYVFGKTLGRRKIAPEVSPNKTWEGFIGGVAAATLIGAALWWITPFNPWQAGLIALAICLAGFAGGLCMSAIKRDRGVKDFGTLIQGHGGVMDRVDSVCFAAPIFFHITRYFFT
ncbi:phosphatidate cytidylyltransferase [Alkalilimnicola ehrlichii]|uniref:Phosphatidate cytidylyltransferase n=1 Tax=Alkalilimnicola ehrlichii TaxID=351052 RepID=A0A3E0WIW2_9GAMM|nr:phosphatidate cytidylyltransferase [Alkalilimnicola ehrlichii]RFA24707.1 phosphatidate cytidylyltransferase [Alkalilimnicola ehrlichii]RFA31805.1 phosphatidate cytidylyltransferase [Alkalilimnicola ehrlichii]